MSQETMIPQRDVVAPQYMYCIIRCERPRQFATRGIGERGDVVHTVHDGALAAVVSDSPGTEYEPSRRNMMAHTLVLEEVMHEFTILPVRFGTVAPSAAAIADRVLRRRATEFVDLLGTLQHRVEMGVKAFWFEQIVYQEIVQEHEEIRQLRDALMNRPAEETYHERIRLGEMVEAALQRKRREDARQIEARLEPLVDELRDSKVLTDQMVVSVACLVDQDRLQAFDDLVQALDAEMGHRLVFKVVGPVPPYNFVNISVNWDA